MESIKCVYCGKEIPENSKFCLECGEPTAPKEIICKECGQILPADAKFCNNCGKNVNDAPSSIDNENGQVQEENVDVSEDIVSTQEEHPFQNLVDAEEDAPAENNAVQDFKMQIESFFSIAGRGVVVTGVIESGALNQGDYVYIGNNGPHRVKGIESFKKILDRAESGMGVGILFSDITENDVVKGTYLTKLNSESSAIQEEHPFQSLLDAEEDAPAENNVAQDFKMQIEDFFSIAGRGVVVTGRIESGVISQGDYVYVGNNGLHQVKGIESFKKILDHAESGMGVGILFTDIKKNDVVKGTYLTKSNSEGSVTQEEHPFQNIVKDEVKQERVVAFGTTTQSEQHNVKKEPSELTNVVQSLYNTLKTTIKEKELGEFRPQIRYQDGQNITFDTLKNALEDAARMHNIPVAFYTGTVKYSGLSGGSEECLVLYHPEHQKDYWKVCIRIKHQGNYAFVTVNMFGVSTLVGNAEAKQNLKDIMKNASGAEKVGALVGAGIRRLLKGGANQQKLEEEQMWYTMISDIFDEVVC